MRRRSRSTALARGVALALVAALASGCRDAVAPDAWSIELEAIEGPEDVSAARVRGWLDGELKAARHFVAPGRAPRLRGALRWAVLQRADAGSFVRLELTVETPAELRAGAGPELDATIELERDDGTVDLERDLPLAIRRAVGVLDARVALARRDGAAIARLMQSEDPEIVLLALDHIEQQRVREHADLVAELLPHDDARVQQRAIECLGAVGSPEHVERLIGAVRLADEAQVRGLYSALARLGGARAQAFLEFAARNEDDPLLAAAAAEALDDALTREQLPDRGEEPVRGHR